MKHKISTAVVFILTLLLLIFIFSNSLRNGENSDLQSSSVTEFINEVTQSLGIDMTVSHSFIRKAAHFCEFALLGLLMFFDLLLSLTSFFSKSTKQLILCTAISPSISFAVACIDETLQLFSEGRAAQLSDVLLDTCGAICGSIVAFCAYFIVHKAIAKSRKL